MYSYRPIPEFNLNSTPTYLSPQVFWYPVRYSWQRWWTACWSCPSHSCPSVKPKRRKSIGISHPPICFIIFQGSIPHSLDRSGLHCAILGLQLQTKTLSRTFFFMLTSYSLYSSWWTAVNVHSAPCPKVEIWSVAIAAYSARTPRNPYNTRMPGIIPWTNQTNPQNADPRSLGQSHAQQNRGKFLCNLWTNSGLSVLCGVCSRLLFDFCGSLLGAPTPSPPLYLSLVSWRASFRKLDNLFDVSRRKLYAARRESKRTCLHEYMRARGWQSAIWWTVSNDKL